MIALFRFAADVFQFGLDQLFQVSFSFARKETPICDPLTIDYNIMFPVNVVHRASNPDDGYGRGWSVALSNCPALKTNWCRRWSRST